MWNEKKLIIGLILSILFQFVILVGMYVNASMPLWTGEEIRVKTTPVDPRSLFRGNYARLEYRFSEVEIENLPKNTTFRSDEIVYVSLKQGKEDLYEYKSASLEKPKSGIFLRGRIQDRYSKFSVHYVKYGIEAFFAPKDKALELEDKLRNGGIALLMVTKSGKVSLKDVIAE